MAYGPFAFKTAAGASSGFVRVRRAIVRALSVAVPDGLVFCTTAIGDAEADRACAISDEGAVERTAKRAGEPI